MIGVSYLFNIYIYLSQITHLYSRISSKYKKGYVRSSVHLSWNMDRTIAQKVFKLNIWNFKGEQITTRGWCFLFLFFDKPKHFVVMGTETVKIWEHFDPSISELLKNNSILPFKTLQMVILQYRDNACHFFIYPNIWLLKKISKQFWFCVNLYRV